MPSRLSGRIKRLESKLNLNAQDTLIVIQHYGESKQQAIERAKKQYPNIKEYDLIFVMNFSNVRKNTRKN